MQAQRYQIGNLEIAAPLYDLINKNAGAVGISPDKFWNRLEGIIANLSPKNAQLLQKRDDIQAKIDSWHKDLKDNKVIDLNEYKSFLRGIDYLNEEVSDFKATPKNVDAEIATLAGPQLVVPVDNERFATNAANARWGSLYDALYGTDLIDEKDGKQKAGDYNPVRGAQVIKQANAFLDDVVGLQSAKYNHVVGFRIAEKDGKKQ